MNMEVSYFRLIAGIVLIVYGIIYFKNKVLNQKEKGDDDPMIRSINIEIYTAVFMFIVIGAYLTIKEVIKIV